MLYFVIVPLAMIAIQLCGVIDWLKREIFYMKYARHVKFKTYRLKPLDCALCLTFWTVLCLSMDPLTALASYSICYVYDRVIEKV